jgi:hypothetical protein
VIDDQTLLVVYADDESYATSHTVDPLFIYKLNNQYLHDYDDEEDGNNNNNNNNNNASMENNKSTKDKENCEPSKSWDKYTKGIGKKLLLKMVLYIYIYIL